MPRNQDESYEDYKKRVIDPKGPGFCAAKWGNATIWLGSGMTASCHHPPAHKIDVNELEQNPSAIHNTKQKKEARRQMVNGERPSECSYCWKVEDNTNAVSDRVYKTVIFDDNFVNDVYRRNPDLDINLKTLEISFDRTCNLACSYCNPAFSTTWVKDIKTNGPYQGLQSDGRNHFTHTHDGAQPFKYGETNPYVEAFWKWWDTGLKDSLTELRITGGEPFMQKDTWDLLERFANEQLPIQLAVNTNLMMDENRLGRLIELAGRIPSLHLYTSNESTGAKAEYIRHGLDSQQWMKNVESVIKSGYFKGVHNMATINALCLPGLSALFAYFTTLKRTYGGKSAINFTLNILRFPTFQSLVVLPTELKQKYRDQLLYAYELLSATDLYEEMEMSHLRRLIEYIEQVSQPTNDPVDIETLRKDFKKFYSQYDKRRGLDFKKTFPELVEWYESIND